jgi:hypothetical protein
MIGYRHHKYAIRVFDTDDDEYLDLNTDRYEPLNEFGLEYDRKIYVPFSPLLLRHGRDFQSNHHV